MKKNVVMRRDQWIKRLGTKSRGVFATVKDDKLQIVCPKRMETVVQHHIQRFLAMNEAETVVLELPSSVNMGKLIGKQGAKRKALKQKDPKARGGRYLRCWEQ